jgi:predicted RNase H-like HicB family nuclease
MAQFWQVIRSYDNERSQGLTGTSGTEAEMNGYRFSAYVIRDNEGWVAHCPDFPDCRAHGETYELALSNLREAIRIYVEDGLGDDEAPPQHDDLSFTTLSF